MPLRKRLTSVLLVVMLFAAALPGASAAAPDWNKNGSLTVRIFYQEKPVKGGTLTLYRVADINTGWGYVLTDEFAGSGVELKGPFTLAMSKKLMDYSIKQNIRGETKTVGSNGTVVFEPLEIGLYLVVQKQSAVGFEPINPFLVSIPMLVDDQFVYDVDASPKTETTPKPTDPTEPTKPPKPPLPQTGQFNWPVPVLAALGTLFLGVGIFLCVARKKEKHEA